ncbi:MAG: hypothetical protein DRP96_11185 [Candidatus Neomarinimicrobiota bacterium]|nr:MAG: hypothetical protein DRP96_11185 [Candidatus Neomarinimicrobiota bacterium]
MRKYLISAIVVLFSGQLFASELPESGALKSAISLYETWLKAKMEYRGIPGCSFAIVYDQKLVYSKGYGYRDMEEKIPATPETLYRVASITKTFTGTAIMQLCDAGKLRLDDPIKKYLPWFDIKSEFNDDPEITIWNLLTHTSGLPAEAAFPYWTDHRFPTREQIEKTLPMQELVYPNQTKWSYSNLAMSLLGYIVEVVSGRKYEDYINENILKPLSMNNSCIDIKKNKKLLKQLAVGYGRRLPDGSHELMPFTDSKGLMPAANLSSTVEDLAKWASFQFSGKSSDGDILLKKSSLREMHRVQWLRPDWESGWGLGWGVRKKGDRTIVGHGGWVAGYRTQISCCPDEKTAFIIMFNADDASPSEYIYKAFDLIAPALVDTYGEKEKIEVAIAPEWKKYVGKYRDPWLWDYDVMILNEKLVIYSYDYPPEEDPRYSLSELTPIGPHTFRIADKNGHGQKVVFEFDEKGNVTRFKKGENYNYRVKNGPN